MHLLRTAASLALGAAACVSASAPPGSAEEGGHWDRVLELPSGNIEAVTFAGDGTAWAAGYGAIFYSGDAGRSWETSRTTGSFLTDIEAAPGGVRGWAVGVLGQFVRTDDGGKTWQDGDPGTDLNLTQVEALDAATLLVAGTGFGLSDNPVFPQPSTFRRSLDGGMSWSEVNLSSVDQRVTALDALTDGEHAWVAAEGCTQVPDSSNCQYGHTLFRSRDGGATWVAAATEHQFREMQFLDPDTGWAVETPCDGMRDFTACHTVITRTRDGGRTWTETLDLGNDVSAALWAEADGLTRVAATSCAQTCTTRLQETHDDGATWTTTSDAVTGYAPDLAFDAAGSGVLTLTDTGYWTDDGGRTLHRAAFPITVGSGDFDFIDANTGWYLASRLLRTDDGGATFEAFSDHRPDQIDFVNANVGWSTDLICDPSCGDRVEIHRTVDGGRTWALQYAHTLGNYLSLTMIDERRGWAHSVGDNILLRTNDGGVTWSPLALPGTRPPVGSLEIDFADANDVFAAEVTCQPGGFSCETHLWRSRDGGADWAAISSLPFPSEGCSVQIEALDATYAWATTYTCRTTQKPFLFRTVDGGASWQWLDMKDDGQVGELTFFDRLNGRGIRAVCPGVADYCDHVIMRTNDGGLSWSHEPAPTDTTSSFDYQFAAPEQAWSSVTAGGGVLPVTGQQLYRYTGVGKIVPPAAGYAERRGDSANVTTIGAIALLIAGIACCAARLRGGLERA